MCCNGVLFQIVRLQPLDSPREMAALGLKVKRKQHEPFFKQPCPAHRDAQCAIYHQRPQRCRIFECRQLKRVAAGEITEATALENIAEAARRVATVERLFERGGETERTKPLRTRYESVMTDRTDVHADAVELRSMLTLAMRELEDFLEKEFRVGGQD